MLRERRTWEKRVVAAPRSADNSRSVSTADGKGLHPGPLAVLPPGCSVLMPGDAPRLGVGCRASTEHLARGRQAATRDSLLHRLQVLQLLPRSSNLADHGTIAALVWILRSGLTTRGRGSAGVRARGLTRRAPALDCTEAARAGQSPGLRGLGLRKCTPRLVIARASATNPSCGRRSRVARRRHARTASCCRGALTGRNRRTLLLGESEHWSAERSRPLWYRQRQKREGEEGKKVDGQRLSRATRT